MLRDVIPAAHLLQILWPVVTLLAVLVLLALFLLVKFINHLTTIARREQEEGKTEPAAKSPELQVLEEIRDTLKK